jgi:hypothetical protein
MVARSIRFAALFALICASQFAYGITTKPSDVSVAAPCASIHDPIAGDANANNVFSLPDVVSIINYTFNKPGWPACGSSSVLCWLSELPCRGDVNGNGGVSLADAIHGVNYIFVRPGGPWDPVGDPPCCWPPVTVK